MIPNALTPKDFPHKGARKKAVIAMPVKDSGTSLFFPSMAAAAECLGVTESLVSSAITDGRIVRKYFLDFAIEPWRS